MAGYPRSYLRVYIHDCIYKKRLWPISSHHDRSSLVVPVNVISGSIFSFISLAYLLWISLTVFSWNSRASRKGTRRFLRYHWCHVWSASLYCSCYSGGLGLVKEIEVNLTNNLIYCWRKFWSSCSLWSTLIRLALINIYWFHTNLIPGAENFRAYLTDECNPYLIRCACNFKGI